jgi:hypothetical protein
MASKQQKEPESSTAGQSRQMSVFRILCAFSAKTSMSMRPLGIFRIIIQDTEQSVSGGKIPSGVLTSSEKVTGRAVVLVQYYQRKQYQQRVEREFRQRQRQQQ